MIIPLNQGISTEVDEEDYWYLVQWNWFIGVGKRNRNMFVRRQGPNKKTILMSRLIMNAPEGVTVDHIDRNPLNNRRSNLRLCSMDDNHCNLNKRRGTSSRFKGVSVYKLANGRIKYQANISKDRKTYYLGLFDSEEMAAEAYDEAANRLHGAFANTNIFMGGK